MKVKKSFKYRIYPTKEQEILLAKHFGSKRFVWNYFLNERKNAYLENNTSLNYYDNASSLTKLKKQDEYIWLKETNSQSVQASLRNLEVAYNRFFSKPKETNNHFASHSQLSMQMGNLIFLNLRNL